MNDFKYSISDEYGVRQVSWLASEIRLPGFLIQWHSVLLFKQLTVAGTAQELNILLTWFPFNEQWFSLKPLQI